VAAFVENVSSNDSVFEVLLGQGRILTLRENLTEGKTAPLVATGDPTVVDFVVINPRQLRVIGQRVGITDLSVTTATGKTYNFEVRVVLNLDLLRARLRCLFPDASLRLYPIRDQVAVEGEARDTAQVAKILEAIRAYLLSLQIAQARVVSGPAGRYMPPAGVEARPGGAPPAIGGPETAPPTSVQSFITPPSILNLIRVPGSHQVLLKVRVAELNRSALRQIGADILTGDPGNGAVIGTQIGGAAVAASANVMDRTLKALTSTSLTPTNTAFGIFERGDFAIFLSALRRNQILKVLAEPNLVALNGQQATFLAGGEFPVPVPQFGGAQGAATFGVTVQFKEFGVRLGFIPFILDGEVIRLTVDPEVSELDFSAAATLVPGGSPVPGVTTRKTHTTVELRQGQTLMVSGLMQLTLNGNTTRIPGFGDLPILGPFFSNTSMDRVEKELVILVTPYLMEPMNPDQVPPTPGDEVKEPNDLELYLLNRIESRTDRDFRSTTKWDDPLHILGQRKLEDKWMSGPHGFED
jgi:pilus assembly protein CpaC